MLQIVDSQEFGLDLDRVVSIAPGVLGRVIDTGRLSLRRLNRAPIAFLARHVPIVRMQRLLTGVLKPRSGDLLLARVGALRQDAELLAGKGELIPLREGMEVVLVYGCGWGGLNPAAAIPASLEPARLIAACGLVGQVADPDEAWSYARVEPLGLLGDAKSRPLNLDEFCRGDGQDN